jgi:hypothetical protein
VEDCYNTFVLINSHIMKQTSLTVGKGVGMVISLLALCAFVVLAASAVEAQVACVNANPSLTITSFGSMTGAPGFTAIPNLDITNNDSVECDLSTFRIEATVPSGVNLFGVPFDHPLPPQTAAWYKFGAKSYATTTPGIYPIVVTITNSTYPGYSTTGTINMVVLDTNAPSVTITSPINGATITQNTTITAEAGDDVSVAGVQFLVDGSALGSEDTSAPFSMAWNVDSVTDGSHSILAIARDISGNISTSSAVTVTVAHPDVTAPTVTITNPPNNYVIPKGTNRIVISSSASDANGISTIEIRTDNVLRKTCSLTTTCAYTWSVNGLSKGNHTVSVQGIDNSPAHNSTTVSVTVKK